MHALIIEDEIHIAAFIEVVLMDLGFMTVDFAASVQEALDAAANRAPDLVTSDVRLAEGSGLDAVGQICASGVIPVIFVTASAGQVFDRYPDAAVVEKPFGARQLEQAIRAMLARKGG